MTEPTQDDFSRWAELSADRDSELGRAVDIILRKQLLESIQEGPA